MSSYSACHWDYHLSTYLFKQYCKEEGRVGLFIYEKVKLGDEYFIPFPNDKDPRDLDQRFVVGENLMINRKRLEQDYTLGKYRKIEPISDIGPILSVETLVLRKNDNKLLGKSVHLANRLGWWINSSKFGVRTDSCPNGYDSQGYSQSGLLHHSLVKEIFFKN